MKHNWVVGISDKEMESMAFDFSQYYIKSLRIPDSRLRQNIENNDSSIQGAFYSMWIQNHKRMTKYKEAKKTNGKSNAETLEQLDKWSREMYFGQGA